MVKRCIFCNQYRTLNDLGECHECEQARLDNEREAAEGDEDYQEPSYDDSVKCCPDCERPNQFGELCVACQRERENT